MFISEGSQGGNGKLCWLQKIKSNYFCWKFLKVIEIWNLGRKVCIENKWTVQTKWKQIDAGLFEQEEDVDGRMRPKPRPKCVHFSARIWRHLGLSTERGREFDNWFMAKGRGNSNAFTIIRERYGWFRDFMPRHPPDGRTFPPLYQMNPLRVLVCIVH